MPAFEHRIAQALTKRRDEGLTRKEWLLEEGNGVALTLSGQRYTNFSSNDYLGLATDSELAKAWQEGISKYGCGSTASPMVTGYSRAHANLNAALCDWLGFEHSTLFSSGFSANQALLFSLLEKEDVLIQDKLNHASLMEAGLLSPAKMKRFRHNDGEHLSQLLTSEINQLVVTEGVFSMDGDLSPLQEIQRITQSNNAWLVVDDAHGIGVLGEEGRGTASHCNIKPDILVVTFGKAFGLSGAAILTSKPVGEYISQFARHYVYSTAMPPSQAYALTHAIGMIRQQEWRREKLAELKDVYRASASSLDGFVDTITPINPFLIGQSEKTLNVAENVKKAGHWLTAIRPPTVATGSARLRITLTANHSNEQVASLVQALTEVLEVSG